MADRRLGADHDVGASRENDGIVLHIAFRADDDRSRPGIEDAAEEQTGAGFADQPPRALHRARDEDLIAEILRIGRKRCPLGLLATTHGMGALFQFARRKLPHGLGRAAGIHPAGLERLAREYRRTGLDQHIGGDDGIVENDDIVLDHAIIAQGAGVDDGVLAHRHVGPDDGRRDLVHDMHRRATGQMDVVADAHGLAVRPHDAILSKRGPRAQRGSAKDRRPGSGEHRLARESRPGLGERQDQERLHADTSGGVRTPLERNGRFKNQTDATYADLAVSSKCSSRPFSRDGLLPRS